MKVLSDKTVIDDTKFFKNFYNFFRGKFLRETTVAKLNGLAKKLKFQYGLNVRKLKMQHGHGKQVLARKNW